MKILFLMASFGSGGSERTVAYLSKYLADKGHDVTVLIISDEVFYELGDNVRLQTLHIPSKPANIVDRYIKMARRLIKTRRAVAAASPDVVFCILPFSAKFILGQKKKCAYKLISSERALPQSYDKKTVRYINKVFGECDGVVFQTERAKKFFPLDIQKKSTVIHNAVGNPFVYETPMATERKKKISAMGRIVSQKDYTTLIYAFADVLKAHPEYTLEIYGAGPDKQELADLAKGLGVAEKVYFCGAHKDAIVRIADSSVYVMSSKFEGMPNALMEAMAVGLPCVSTDCPNGPAELIEDGVNGLLVPVGDSKALAKAMLKMIEDREFAERCAENARKILTTHSIDKKAAEYEAYILSIAERKND